MSERLLADWLAKARLVRGLREGELWPAWSAGECLAVAVLLNDTNRLAAMDYTAVEALERLRWDIGQPSVEAAAAVFDRLRSQIPAVPTKTNERTP